MKPTRTTAKQSKEGGKKQPAAITKKMLIGEVLAACPESVPAFLESGFHCLGCGAANWETIEQGAISHGIDADELVKKINAKTKKS